jgi:hypothetical protein
MKRAIATVAVLVASVFAVTTSTAFAAGGSGGGGTSTGGGGTSTGGGGVKVACTPTITLTGTTSTVPGERSLTVSYVTACASKSRVSIQATNLSNGTVAWNAPVDSINTSYTWNAPLFGTSYRLDAQVYSNLGPLLATTTTTIRTMSAPANCGPFLTASATAGTSAAAYGITAGYNLIWCTGTPLVLLSATNTSTGVTEWSQYATVTNSLSFPNPKFATTYRIDATAYDGGNVLAQASTNVTTMATPPNCATITNENLSVGYWGTYAAIWNSYAAKDCGYGMTSVHMRITNKSSGLVEADYWNLPLNYLIDFEGPAVSYNTTYQVDVEVRGAGNEVLDSSSRSVLTPPAK